MQVGNKDYIVSGKNGEEGRSIIGMELFWQWSKQWPFFTNEVGISCVCNLRLAQRSQPLPSEIPVAAAQLFGFNEPGEFHHLLPSKCLQSFCRTSFSTKSISSSSVVHLPHWFKSKLYKYTLIHHCFNQFTIWLHLCLRLLILLRNCF